MKMKTKSIFKKIALVLAGIAAISVVSFGIVKLVEFTQQDLKTVNLSFDVGNLGTDGKYVNDETTLYTKDAFKCDGLQIKLDFDNAINYQIYFYNDLDTFIQSTDILTGPYSGGIHDSYARVVIIPTDDEDNKISWFERFTYAGQLEIKVNKVQNTEYIDVFNRRLKIVDDKSNLRFNYGMFLFANGNYQFKLDITLASVTSMDLLRIRGGSTVTCNYTIENGTCGFDIVEFKIINGNLVLVNWSNTDKVTTVLSKETEYIVIVFGMSDGGLNIEIPANMLEKIPTFISITK